MKITIRSESSSRCEYLVTMEDDRMVLVWIIRNRGFNMFYYNSIPRKEPSQKEWRAIQEFMFEKLSSHPNFRSVCELD